MKHLLDLLKSSASELKSTLTIAISAMLLALSLALRSLAIPVTSFLRITFSFLTNAVCGMLYGPVVAGLVAGSADIIAFFLFPKGGGGYFPGFTLNAILGGVIYGLFFYRQKISIPRIVMAKLTVSLIVNLILGTYWNSILYGDVFFSILPLRALKECIKVPVDVVLIWLVLKAVVKVRQPRLSK